MKLDPQKCPVGTVGFIPPGSSYEFEGHGDFDWFKEPYVILCDDGRWHVLNDGSATDELFAGAVYSDWKEAALRALDDEAKQANEQIAEATQWLNYVQNLAKRIHEAE